MTPVLDVFLGPVPDFRDILSGVPGPDGWSSACLWVSVGSLLFMLWLLLRVWLYVVLGVLVRMVLAFVLSRVAPQIFPGSTLWLRVKRVAATVVITTVAYAGSRVAMDRVGDMGGLGWWGVLLLFVLVEAVLFSLMLLVWASNEPDTDSSQGPTVVEATE